MAQPTVYSRSYSFSDYQTASPTLPLPGVHVDGELNSVQQTLGQICTNLALIQRDDGAIANASVGIDQLKSEVTIGLNAVSDWIIGGTYVENEGVWYEGKLYYCLVAHTGTVFATDIAAGKWSLILDLQSEATDVAEAAIADALGSAGVGDPLIGASSSTFAVADTGTITPTLSTGRAWGVGTRLRLAITASPANYAEGIVGAYNSTTGASSIVLDNAGGSGTASAWTVSVAGDKGSSGAAADFVSAAAVTALEPEDSILLLQASSGDVVQITYGELVNLIRAHI